MIVAPSVLSLDFTKFKEQLLILEQSQARWCHFDVMDGHFVPNLTYGPTILEAVKKVSTLFMDVHLMVKEPRKFVDMFVKAGADQLTFHLEALASEEATIELINYIHAQGVKVGISIKPNTPKEALDPYFELVDLILIMSVEPGFGGQTFMAHSLSKIRYAKEKLQALKSKALVQVDGGINAETIKLVKDAGVDVVVAGSYIFKEDILKAVASLCEA